MEATKRVQNGLLIITPTPLFYVLFLSIMKNIKKPSNINLKLLYYYLKFVLKIY
jgi:hypothetical protein